MDDLMTAAEKLLETPAERKRRLTRERVRRWRARQRQKREDAPGKQRAREAGAREPQPREIRGDVG